MVKPILQLYPVLPAASEEERASLRPLGRNVERYHDVVHGMTGLVKAADELGFWGVSTIEHHFHSEGYEVGPSPGTLNAYWAALTRNVRVGQLGYTMSAQNPIRVAEETAILDRVNRDIFEEQIDLVLDSWKADSIERPAGGRWEIPYPYADGIEWGMREATAKHGAEGEI